MDFPLRLIQIFKDNANEENSTTLCSAMNEWNDGIEDFLGAPLSQDQTKVEHTNDCSKDDIVSMARQLHTGIIGSILPSSDGTESNLENNAEEAKQYYLKETEIADIEGFSCYVRASKNLLRWYIQIFLERKGSQLPSLVKCLQSKVILSLLVSVLETEETNMENGQQARARNISLYLFYATYSAFPGDVDSEEALKHLIFEVKFTNIVLRILTRPCTPALMLSLVRNIHTALVSLQGAGQLILGTQIDWKGSSTGASDWAPKESCPINFQSTCIELLRYALDSDPAFPGDKEDKRIDLVTEILGAFYAIRMGRALNIASSTGNPKLLQIVLDILKLPDTEDKRVSQCKISTISLLMDSDRSLGEELLNNDAFTPLLKLLETQVSSTINNTKVDDSAAASLVPILVVLNKFATTNAKVCRAAKLFVFPAEAEGAFQEKAREQLNVTKKNMSPLNAPKGTFRYSLISLMTWPQGHIKRCVGELLWTLCSSDATEFVHRIGFGNGMPILGVKGIVQMPQQGVIHL